MQKGMATVGVEETVEGLLWTCKANVSNSFSIKDVNIQSIPTVTVITLLAPLTFGLIFK